MSAGEPLPTTIYVHPYLTADGQKLSKSSGHVVDPVDVVDAYGSDALRWWLVRDVPPATDTDYTAERLIARANEDLANGIGNLTNRTIAMARQVFRGGLFDGSIGDRERHLVKSARLAAVRALDLRDFDFRAATAPLLAVVADANRLIEEKRPWELAKSDPTEAAGVLRSLLDVCGLIANALSPFVPTVAERLQAQLDAPLDGALPPPGFQRLDTRT
jgi:methionyl-tRNA synthetase